MEKLSVPLALVDFVAFALSTIGFICLTRMIATINRECGVLALVGLLQITLGGFAKALWQILLVTTNTHPVVLNNLQFILLAPGIVCLTWALWNLFRASGRVPVWVVPVIIITAAEGAAAIRVLSKGGNGWFIVLVGVATVANISASLLLIRESWRRGVTLVAVLFAFNLVVMLGQLGMARIVNRPVTFQWMEHLNNLFAWLAFAYASWKLDRHITGRRF